MATLLIIGGSGFFGKSILDSFKRGLLEKWSIKKIIVLCRNPDNLKYYSHLLLNDNVELLCGDITKITDIPFAEFVIHAASSSNAKDYENNKLEAKENIIFSIKNYCELARKYHKTSKILYVSSGAVYGNQPFNLEKISEDFHYNDSNDIPSNKKQYTIGKRIAENYFQALGHETIKVCIARCFSFVGRWLPLDQHFAVGNFINDGLLNRAIIVKADHRVYRSYLYADDLVEWLMTILDNADYSCPVYNVGSDESILIDELAYKISQLFGLSFNNKIYTSELVERYVPDIKKAKKNLNLNIKYSLNDALVSTIESIKCN